MPRKHPVLGVNVLTMGEFLNQEAEHEGKGRSGGDILEDMFNEMDAEDRKIEKEWKKPDVALTLFQNARYYDEDDLENADPEIVAIEEVLDAQNSSGLRGSKGMVLARVKLADGTIKKARWVFWDEPGGYLDPPDGGEEIEWIDDDQAAEG